MFTAEDRALLAAFEEEIAQAGTPCSTPEGGHSTFHREMGVYREVLDRWKQRVAEMHAGGASGQRVCRLLAGLVDRIVFHAFRSCFPGDGPAGIAVFALGGYGRRELNPFSDVDLLFLMDRRAQDAPVSEMLRFLWDLNLDIGHSTRTVEECMEAAGEDSYLATSLLEARFLAGDDALREMFRERYNDWVREGAGRDIALGKIEERRLRLDSFNGTVQIQTPNVKESPGGLRDIHAARWISALSGGDGTVESLAEAGHLTPGETSAYAGAFDFLLRVRNGLHFVSGKKNDLLHHLILPELAANLGYPGEGVQPVESLMRDYYRHAGAVFRLTGRMLERYLELISPDPGPVMAILPIGLRSGGTHVAFLHEQESFLDRYPHLALEICTVAGMFDFRLTGNSASVLDHWASKRDGTLGANPDVRQSFHEMVNLRSGVSRALRLLHEHGVLGRLIPEFGAIAWHYQYDYYHAFTTDEHSIRVVENLERMAEGTFDLLPELHEVMADVTAKGALYLAGLLHDVGKADGGPHSVQGERLAARALKRICADDRTVELVRFLIREHLLMSHTSQRRDMDDPDTIRDFTERVRSTGRLRMLTALTFADLASLASGALTDWKKSLLWSLYTRAYLLLEKGYEQTVSVRDADIEKTVRALRETVPEEIIQAHVSGLPEQYLRVTAPSLVRDHLRGIARMERRGAWASFRHRKGLTYLTVICRDYSRALSDICGTITASDIGIVAAQIFTRSDGVVIDTFLVVTGSGETRIPPESQRTFKDMLPKVVSGEIRARDLIRSHALRWKRRKRNVVSYPPRVRADNAISPRYTVLDVFATDYTGLLYDITSVLAARGIDIHTARIGTDEDQVADAFYIERRGGGKIEGEELESLKREIVERIEREG